MRRALLALCLVVLAAAPARAEHEPWMDEFGAIPVQHAGRVMPLDSYARDLAAQLTGRTRWSGERGPEGYRDREPVELLCDLLFTPELLLDRPIIGIENRPFKTRVRLDPTRRFFTPTELASNRALSTLLDAFSARRELDPTASPLPDQARALDISAALDRVASFNAHAPLPVVASGRGNAFLRAGPDAGEPGTESVRQALAAFGRAYTAGTPLDGPARALAEAVRTTGSLDPRDSRSVRLELFYNRHAPWRETAVAYTLAIIAFGLSRLTLRKLLIAIAVVLGVWGVGEHLLGIGLRTAILGRAPVSNTYESLLWMGLVAIALGLVAQAMNRRGSYLFAGVCAALVSVLFAGLVPLQDQTNALPAVLRSNFWLTVHVLTIVASYGVLAVASVLGHVYLVRFALLGQPTPASPRVSHPLIVQTYRTIQIGLILLTAGTILGGVWAADSWGRFWGWDPKETWALISIVVYFAVLHARHVRWLDDFGLAAAAVLGFAAIVWTFYGVNYVMATGLHNYGFGSGGERWVAVWALGEAAFLIACRLRFRSRAARSPKRRTGTESPPAA